MVTDRDRNYFIWQNILVGLLIDEKQILSDHNTLNTTKFENKNNHPHTIYQSGYSDQAKSYLTVGHKIVTSL